MCKAKLAKTKAIEIIVTAGVGQYQLSSDTQLSNTRIRSIQYVDGDISPLSPISSGVSVAAATATACYLLIKTGGQTVEQIEENYPVANLANFAPVTKYPMERQELAPQLNADGSYSSRFIDFTQSRLIVNNAAALTTGQVITFIVEFE